VTQPAFDARAYWDRRLGRNWSLHGVGQSRLSHSFNRWGYRVRRNVFLRTVRSLPVDLRQARVLDVGSGTGFYIDLWRRRLGVQDLTGFDIADSAVRQLGERFPDVAFERRDISDEDVADLGEQFDVIDAFDVLFHIVDDTRYRRAFANISTLLRPGGYFIFSEHFVHTKKRRVPGGHHVSHPLREIKRIVRANGFQIVSRRPMMMFTAWPVDSTAPWRRTLWRKMAPATTSERWGNVLGAVLYPIDVLLCRMLREGPTVEIMVCRKIGEPKALRS